MEGNLLLLEFNGIAPGEDHGLTDYPHEFTVGVCRSTGSLLGLV
jgi:hypothetical protein